MNANDKEILIARAKQLSLPVQNDRDVEDATLVVCFLLYPERYAVEATYVDGVFPLNNLTIIPGTNAIVSGVMNIRGETYPLVNLKRLMGLHERGLTGMDKVVLLRDGEMAFGLLVDEVMGSEQVDRAQLAQAPATLHSSALKYIRGIVRGGIIMLDVKQILKGEFYS